MLWCWSSAWFLSPRICYASPRFSSARFRTSLIGHVGVIPVSGIQTKRTRGSVKGLTSPFILCCPGRTVSSVMTRTSGGWLVPFIVFTVSLFSLLFSICYDMFVYALYGRSFVDTWPSHSKVVVHQTAATKMEWNYSSSSIGTKRSKSVPAWQCTKQLHEDGWSERSWMSCTVNLTSSPLNTSGMNWN